MPVAVRRREPPALALVPQDGWDWIGLSPKGKELLFGDGEWVRAFQEEFFELCRPAAGIVEWYPGRAGSRCYVVIALICQGEYAKILAQPTLATDKDPAECAREAYRLAAFRGSRG